MVTLDEFVVWNRGEFFLPFQAARQTKPGFEPQQENRLYVDVEVAWPGRFGARTFPACIQTIPLKNYLRGIDDFYKKYQNGEFGKSIHFEQRQNIRKRYEYKIGNEVKVLSEQELVNIAFDETLSDRLPISFYRRNWWQEISVFLPGDHFELFCAQLRSKLPTELHLGEELREKRWFDDPNSEVDYLFYPLSYEKQYSQQHGIWGSGTVRRLLPPKTGTRPDWPNLVQMVWRGGGRGCANVIKSVAEVVQKQQYEAIFSLFRNEYDVTSDLGRGFEYILRGGNPDRRTIGGVFYKPKERSGL